MATTSELNVCDSCWDDRDISVDQHRCGARSMVVRSECLASRHKQSHLIVSTLAPQRC